MKNSPFKQTFYGGVVLFSFLFLFILTIIYNIYNFITPKIDNLFNKETIVVESVQIDSSYMENDTPFEVINKPIKKVVDTLRITPKNDVKISQSEIIIEKKDSTIVKDTTN